MPDNVKIFSDNIESGNYREIAELQIIQSLSQSINRLDTYGRGFHGLWMQICSGLEEELSNLEKILLEYEDKNGEIYSHIEKDELQKFIDHTMEKARINRKNFEDDFCYLYKHLENPKDPLEILYKSLYVLSLKDDSNKNK